MFFFFSTRTTLCQYRRHVSICFHTHHTGTEFSASIRSRSSGFKLYQSVYIHWKSFYLALAMALSKQFGLKLYHNVHSMQNLSIKHQVSNELRARMGVCRKYPCIAVYCALFVPLKLPKTLIYLCDTME